MDITFNLRVKSHIQRLSFNYSGDFIYSNWKIHPERFRNIMRAISESPIQDSLQELRIRGCEITLEECKNLLRSLGMANLTIIDTY